MMEIRLTQLDEIATRLQALEGMVARLVGNLPGAPSPAAPAQGAAPATAVPVASPNPSPTPAANAPAAGPVSAAPDNPPPPAVPVAGAPAYTIDQISRAGAALVDAGKMEQLLQLLGRYGVQAVTQLQPEQYGAFATELRGLGAQI